MKIGIIDADLIHNGNNRFPNLACMKLSGWHKSKNDEVLLLINYEHLDNFDIVYISKVFSETKVPDKILNLPNVKYGGTGFFYDKAPFLPNEIEHFMPDYDLYNNWVKDEIDKKIKAKEKKIKKLLNQKQIKKIKNSFKYYLNYSIGFTSRFCFRGCKFCVNQNFKKVKKWSPLCEFVDSNKPKICLLDDNLFGCKDWKQILNNLQLINKPFQYKQGLDERLLTNEKVNILFNSSYDGDLIFAFDNIQDAELIENKLKLIRSIYKNNSKHIKFYVLCAFDIREKSKEETIKKQAYTGDFWVVDIENTFKRIKILMKYRCFPYIMRYEQVANSPYYGTYVSLAGWCNQPKTFTKKSYREWCIAYDISVGGNSAIMKYLNQFEKDYPQIAKQYYDMKLEDEYQKLK